MISVVEYTDAMCSWAWGTEPKLRLLRWRFEDQIDSWRLVMGHLVEDEHMPDRDPVAGAPKLQEYWKVVCDQTGMPRPNPLRRTTTGSRASGMAVKAAQLQGDHAAQAVMRTMRQATFINGEPADTTERAIEACLSIEGAPDGFDVEALGEAMTGNSTVVDAYNHDYEETRTPNEHVLNLEGDRPGIGRARPAQDGRMRFVFPTVLIGPIEGAAENSGNPAAVETTVPGWMPYEDYEKAMFDAGAQATERTKSRPSPDEAFARWPQMAKFEFEYLCGADAAVPATVQIDERPGGTIYTNRRQGSV